MPKEVIFPKVDMDMESGLLSEWLCANGDTVSEGQPIFVIETDKSAMEIESVASGRIAIGESITGSHYPVGQVMAYIYEPHEVIAAPVNDVTTKRLSATSIASEPMVPATNNKRVNNKGFFRASPAARRIAAEYGIALSRVSGSARRGRIVKADVMAQVPSGDAMHQSNVAQAAIKRIPHTQMRRTIAARLTHAVQTIPSYQVMVDCQCESVLQTSHELNSCLSSGSINTDYQGKVSLNVFFMKALGLALADIPQANCQWSEEAMLQYESVDVGLAVALEGGLITPIVRSANSKSVLEIASDSQSLIERAKNGSLAKSEYEGGVSTVSNLGMFGISEFTSIVNPPQSSIVSIGTVAQSAVAIENQLQVKPKCQVTFTFDHRVIDGAVGARVATRFKEIIETSVRMLL